MPDDRHRDDGALFRERSDFAAKLSDLGEDVAEIERAFHRKTPSAGSELVKRTTRHSVAFPDASACARRTDSFFETGTASVRVSNSWGHGRFSVHPRNWPSRMRIHPDFSIFSRRRNFSAVFRSVDSRP